MERIRAVINNHVKSMSKPNEFALDYGLVQLDRSGTDAATMQTFYEHSEQSLPFVKASVVRDSRSTPDYKALKAAGVALPQNAFSYREMRCAGTVYWQKTSQSDQGNGLATSVEVRKSNLGVALRPYYSVIPPESYCYPQFYSQLVSQSDLYLRARTNIRGETSNLSVSAVESAETARMAVALSSLAFRSARAAARGDIVGVVRILRQYKPLSESHPAIRSLLVRKINRELADKAVRSAGDRLTQRRLGIRDSLNRLNEAVRRHSSSGSQGSLSAVSNAWMTWRYGIRPLLSDISSMASHMADRAWDQRTGVKSFRASISRTQEFREPTLLQCNGVVIPAHQISTIKESRRLTVLYRVSDPTAREADQLFGNPWEVIWEVIPLSFVFDWFVPVGKFLGAINATSGLTFLDGFEGYKREVDTTFVTDRSSDPSVVQGVSGYVRFVEVVRSRQNGIPGVDLTNISIAPSSDLANNLRRLTDSVVLGRQLVGKFR